MSIGKEYENYDKNNRSTYTSVPMYIIMCLGILFPVAGYLFGMEVLQYMEGQAANHLILYGLMLMLLVPILTGIYAFDILKLYQKTGRFLGALLLFIIYKPAYPLYRQCALEKKPWLALGYLFVAGIISAVVIVRFIMAVAMSGIL